MSVPHRLTVLLVEDNADAPRSLADLLRLHGHRVTTAATAREAVEAADREPPDVAVLDIGLPDGSGWHVARQLREAEGQRAGRPLMIIAVTGWGADDDRWRSVRERIDLHLVKPADPTLLVGVLDRYARGGERGSAPPAGPDAAAPRAGDAAG